MKLALIATAALAISALPRAMAEEPRALTLRSKSAIATAVAPHRWAPYAQPLGVPEPEPLFPRRDLREDASRSSCESDRDLCYDVGSGRIVYKPARQYMPEIPGLRPESISLKRNKITFKYSF